METRFTYKIVIPDDERRKFKQLAKSRGMTIQGLLASLIRAEIRTAEKNGLLTEQISAGGIYDAR